MNLLKPLLAMDSKNNLEEQEKELWPRLKKSESRAEI